VIAVALALVLLATPDQERVEGLLAEVIPKLCAEFPDHVVANAA
jgi:hypothetical protein